MKKVFYEKLLILTCILLFILCGCRSKKNTINVSEQEDTSNDIQIFDERENDQDIENDDVLNVFADSEIVDENVNKFDGKFLEIKMDEDSGHPIIPNVTYEQERKISAYITYIDADTKNVIKDVEMLGTWFCKDQFQMLIDLSQLVAFPENYTITDEDKIVAYYDCPNMYSEVNKSTGDVNYYVEYSCYYSSDKRDGYLRFDSSKTLHNSIPDLYPEESDEMVINSIENVQKYIEENNYNEIEINESTWHLSLFFLKQNEFGDGYYRSPKVVGTYDEESENGINFCNHLRDIEGEPFAHRGSITITCYPNFDCSNDYNFIYEEFFIDGEIVEISYPSHSFILGETNYAPRPTLYCGVGEHDVIYCVKNKYTNSVIGYREWSIEVPEYNINAYISYTDTDTKEIIKQQEELGSWSILHTEQMNDDLSSLLAYPDEYYVEDDNGNVVKYYINPQLTCGQDDDTGNLYYQVKYTCCYSLNPIDGYLYYDVNKQLDILFPALYPESNLMMLFDHNDVISFLSGYQNKNNEYDEFIKDTTWCAEIQLYKSEIFGEGYYRYISSLGLYDEDDGDNDIKNSLREITYNIIDVSPGTYKIWFDPNESALNVLNFIKKEIYIDGELVNETFPSYSYVTNKFGDIGFAVIQLEEGTHEIEFVVINKYTNSIVKSKTIMFEA